MKLRRLGVLAALVLASMSVPTAHAAALFSRALYVGSQGADVLALQKLLNQNPATQIAASGPGSPGHETDYFGSLTKNAVIRYQDEHASVILTPLGLSLGTGFVGPSTRAVLLAQLSTNSTSAPSSVSATTTPPVASAQHTTAAPSAIISPFGLAVSNPSNPNQIDLDQFMSEVDSLGKKQHMASSTLAHIEKAMRAVAATTTDLRAEFLKHAALVAMKSPSLETRALALAAHALASLGLVNIAEAAIGVPFGGMLTYAMPCTCSTGTWLVGVTPRPPSYATVLGYVEGTQVFANYNIPVTTYMVGAYEPGVQACWMYVGVGCAPPPQYGVISPETGSTAL